MEITVVRISSLKATTVPIPKWKRWVAKQLGLEIQDRISVVAIIQYFGQVKKGDILIGTSGSQYFCTEVAKDNPQFQGGMVYLSNIDLTEGIFHRVDFLVSNKLIVVSSAFSENATMRGQEIHRP